MKLTEVYVTEGRSAVTGELEYQVADKNSGVPMVIKTVKPGRRFGHYLIDTAMFLLVFLLLLFITFTIDPYFDVENSAVTTLLQWFGMVAYYFVCESLLQTSIGKMATGCVVIDEYGEKPDVAQILGRSFARIIPFEALSCLGNPSRGWHDSMSSTYVVTKSDLAKMLKLREEYQTEGATAYHSLITE